MSEDRCGCHNASPPCRGWSEHATPDRVAWEYAWLTDGMKPVDLLDLQEYGDHGWELVSVILLPGAIREWFFKRPKATRQ